MKLLDTLIFFSLSISIAIDQKLIVAFVCHLLTEIISQNNSNQSYGRMFLSKANCNFYQINSKYTTTKCEFQFKSSQAKLHFQYPQKTSGIQSYHDVFRGYRKNFSNRWVDPFTPKSLLICFCHKESWVLFFVFTVYCCASNDTSKTSLRSTSNGNI